MTQNTDEAARYFSITEDTQTHDATGRGLEMGLYRVRVYRNGQQISNVRVQPDTAYARAKRMLADGWLVKDEATQKWVAGMRNVERAFEEDAKRAHLYDKHGKLKEATSE